MLLYINDSHSSSTDQTLGENFFRSSLQQAGDKIVQTYGPDGSVWKLPQPARASVDNDTTNARLLCRALVVSPSSTQEILGDIYRSNYNQQRSPLDVVLTKNQVITQTLAIRRLLDEDLSESRLLIRSLLERVQKYLEELYWIPPLHTNLDMMLAMAQHNLLSSDMLANAYLFAAGSGNNIPTASSLFERIPEILPLPAIYLKLFLILPEREYGIIIIPYSRHQSVKDHFVLLLDRL